VKCATVYAYVQPSLYKTVTPTANHSAVITADRPPSHGVQLFERVGDDQLEVDAVGRPLPHLSAQQHATGEAIYVDDIPSYSGIVPITVHRWRLSRVWEGQCLKYKYWISDSEDFVLQHFQGHSVRGRFCPWGLCPGFLTAVGPSMFAIFEI